MKLKINLDKVLVLSQISDLVNINQKKNKTFNL